MQTPLRITLTLLAALAPLRADYPRVGVQGTVNIPMIDLKDYVDSKPGPGIGVHATWDLSDGHVARLRADYSAYPQATFATVKRKASDLSLGADYLFFIAGKPEGLYITTGVAGVRWSFDTTGGTSAVPGTTTKVSLSGGVGYQWNDSVGTEVRWTHCRVQSDFKADALQLGVTVRF